MCLLREGLEYAILRRSFSGSASHLPQIFRQPIKSPGTVHVAPHSKQRIFLKSVKTVSRSSVCTGDFSFLRSLVGLVTLTRTRVLYSHLFGVCYSAMHSNVKVSQACIVSPVFGCSELVFGWNQPNGIMRILTPHLSSSSPRGVLRSLLAVRATGVLPVALRCAQA